VSAIEVLKPGLSTTVQDTGRTGYYDVGIPPSGALDQYSLRAANLLVGNPAGAAALECVYLGPELGFTADGVVAVWRDLCHSRSRSLLFRAASPGPGRRGSCFG